VESREVALASNDGLLRDGPQYVGSVRPSWMSIKRRAVLGWEVMVEDLILE